MDEGGEFIYPNELIAMLVDYLSKVEDGRAASREPSRPRT